MATNQVRIYQTTSFKCSCVNERYHDGIIGISTHHKRKSNAGDCVNGDRSNIINKGKHKPPLTCWPEPY